MHRKSFKIFDGIKVCCSGHIALPLMVFAGMAGTGAAIGIGIAITSSGLWGKMFTLVEKQRKHPVLEGAFVDKQEDRISLLSDDLLSDIISRLNMIEAVRTRILSRRWRNIFQSRSKLHFCCNMFRSVQHNNKSSHNCSHKLRFIKAVDQCLKHFSGQRISYFGLECCLGKEFDSNFKRWMQSFAIIGVQELMVKFCSAAEFHLFPFQLLFESTSLKRLVLRYCTLQPSFKGLFKSLQFLYLGVVPLHGEEFTSILSSCVNLHRITVDHCKLPPKLCISGQSLQLKCVRIQSCYGVEEIEICHGSLIIFLCYTDRMMTYSVPFAPKLDLMGINFNGKSTVPYFFREVAKDCGQLTDLVIQTKTDTLPYIPTKANTLSNLRSLYLLTLVNTKVDLLDVRPILAACPLLEYFRLLVRGPIGNEPRGRKFSIAAGHHAHLKLMELQGFRGTRNEIELASYVLRTASRLKRLCLFTSYEYFRSNFSKTEHKEYVMDDDERQLIYKELEGQAISTRAVLDIQAGFFIVEE